MLPSPGPRWLSSGCSTLPLFVPLLRSRAYCVAIIVHNGPGPRFHQERLPQRDRQQTTRRTRRTRRTDKARSEFLTCSYQICYVIYNISSITDTEFLLLKVLIPFALKPGFSTCFSPWSLCYKAKEISHSLESRRASGKKGCSFSPNPHHEFLLIHSSIILRGPKVATAQVPTSRRAGQQNVHPMGRCLAVKRNEAPTDAATWVSLETLWEVKGARHKIPPTV